MSVKGRSTSKTFWIDGIAFTAVNVLNKVIPFLLLPILVSTLTVSDFGVYSLFTATEQVMLPIVSLILYSSIGRHYFDREEMNFPSYVTGIVLMQLLNMLLVFCIVQLIPASVINEGGLNKGLLKMTVISTCFTGILNVLLVLNRAEKNIVGFAIFFLLQSISLFGFVWLALGYEKNAEMATTGRVINSVLFGVIAITILIIRRLINFKPEIELAKKALRYSLPALPAAITSLIFVLSDRFFIEHFLGLEAVAYYSGVNQIAAAIMVFSSALASAWTPTVFENLKRNTEASHRLLKKLTYSLKAFFILIGIIFIVLYPFACKLLLKPDYLKYTTVGMIIVCNFVLQAFYMIMVPYINYFEKNKYLSYYSLVVALFNIIANLVFVPMFGLYGAAFTLTASWTLMYLLVLKKSFSLFPPLNL